MPENDANELVEGGGSGRPDVRRVIIQIGWVGFSVQEGFNEIWWRASVFCGDDAMLDCPPQTEHGGYNRQFMGTLSALPTLACDHRLPPLLQGEVEAAVRLEVGRAWQRLLTTIAREAIQVDQTAQTGKTNGEK